MVPGNMAVPNHGGRWMDGLFDDLLWDVNGLKETFVPYRTTVPIILSS